MAGERTRRVRARVSSSHSLQANSLDSFIDQPFFVFVFFFPNSEPIKCGDLIRLEHLTTRKNLHSHFFQSPLSAKQEISCYGEDGKCAMFASVFMPRLPPRRRINASCSMVLNNYRFVAGVGDTGDHWKVECSSDYWLRDNSVKLRHKDTGAYLSVSGRTFGRPINGQMEIIGTTDAYHATEWKTVEGLFIHPRDAASSKPVHTEL